MSDVPDDEIGALVYAIEDLIEDMEFRRNPPGTWGGWERTKPKRQGLYEALKAVLEKRNSDGSETI